MERVFVGLPCVMEKLCLPAQGFSCPTLFAQGLFSTLGEPCGAGPAMGEAGGTSCVSLKHMAGDGTVQHVELAVPGDEELF